MKICGLVILILQVEMVFQHLDIQFYQTENEVLHKKFEDLVDIGIYECEKFYPSFQQVLFDDISPKEAIKFSKFEIIGRA